MRLSANCKLLSTHLCKINKNFLQSDLTNRPFVNIISIVAKENTGMASQKPNPTLLMHGIKENVMIKNSSSASKNTHGFIFRIASIIVAAAFIISCTSYAYAANGAKQINIVDGEKSISISSKSTNPAEIVRLAGIRLGAYDEIDAMDFSGKDGDTIAINRAKILRVEDDGNVAYYVGYSNTIAEIFEDRGIKINEGDVVSSDLGSKVFDGMRLLIKRAFTITVEADGKEISIPVTDITVAEALERAGIVLGEKDTVVPALDSTVNESTRIKVSRVEFKTTSEKKSIDFSTDVVYDSDMYVGDSKIVSEGKKGVKEIFTSEKYVDGVLVETNPAGEIIAEAPVNAVKKVGTKSKDELGAYKNSASPISELAIPAGIELDENGAPVNYKSKVEAKATAYTGDPETASGRKPMAGHIAVDPSEYPYGTELFITSADGSYVYGYCIAADTGGFVQMGNTDIDLYMNNEQMCDDWGNRDITIYVL